MCLLLGTWKMVNHFVENNVLCHFNRIITEPIYRHIQISKIIKTIIFSFISHSRDILSRFHVLSFSFLCIFFLYFLSSFLSNDSKIIRSDDFVLFFMHKVHCCRPLAAHWVDSFIRFSSLYSNSTSYFSSVSHFYFVCLFWFCFLFLDFNFMWESIEQGNKFPIIEADKDDFADKVEAKDTQAQRMNRKIKMKKIISSKSPSIEIRFRIGHFNRFFVPMIVDSTQKKIRLNYCELIGWYKIDKKIQMNAKINRFFFLSSSVLTFTFRYFFHSIPLSEPNVSSFVSIF